MRSRRTRAWGLFVVLATMVGWACSASSPQSSGGQQWTGGRKISDVELEAALTPDVPVESSGLFLGKDRKAYYVATLRSDPPLLFERRYSKLIESRGILGHRVTGSAHAIVPRVYGYEFLFLKKGRVKPFSLYYRKFNDYDPDPASNAELPDPLSVEGRRLVLRLGFGVQGPWKESILVPAEDLIEVKELPFPRFPGAVLADNNEPDEYTANDRRLIEGRVISRIYVYASSFSEVAAHYRRTLTELGMPVKPFGDPIRELGWQGRGRSDGMERVDVEEMSNWFAAVPKTQLTTEELRQRLPSLMEGLPSNAQQYRVIAGFRDPETAAQYWSSKTQELRRSLLESGRR